MTTRLTVIKATPTQKAQHAADGGLYLLHGFVQVGAHKCELEDLRGCWRAPDPVWELHAPVGHIFQPHGLHSLLGYSQGDLTERLEGTTVEVCHCEAAECDAHWAGVGAAS